MEIRLDPASTTIHWTLNSLLHKARGSFTLKGGDLAINPKTGLAQGEILVDATSGTSGDAARDAKWQKEILDSTTYPGILFHPNKIEGLKVVDGMQQVQASGALTLRGQDHPVELTLSVQVNGEDVVVTTHFMVPYVQWGLKQATSGIIRYDKQIAIDMTAKGELETGKGSPAGRPAPDSQ
jgi:polyisoprenoid-binding protein YceI